MLARDHHALHKGHTGIHNMMTPSRHNRSGSLPGNECTIFACFVAVAHNAGISEVPCNLFLLLPGMVVLALQLVSSSVLFSSSADGSMTPCAATLLTNVNTRHKPARHKCSAVMTRIQCKSWHHSSARHDTNQMHTTDLSLDYIHGVPLILLLRAQVMTQFKCIRQT